MIVGTEEMLYNFFLFNKNIKYIYIYIYIKIWMGRIGFGEFVIL